MVNPLESKKEDAIMNGGLVGVLLGNRVRERAEGGVMLLVERERVGGEAVFDELALLQIEPDRAEGHHPFS